MIQGVCDIFSFSDSDASMPLMEYDDYFTRDVSVCIGEKGLFITVRHWSFHNENKPTYFPRIFHPFVATPAPERGFRFMTPVIKKQIWLGAQSAVHGFIQPVQRKWVGGQTWRRLNVGDSPTSSETGKIPLFSSE